MTTPDTVIITGLVMLLALLVFLREEDRKDGLFWEKWGRLLKCK